MRLRTCLEILKPLWILARPRPKHEFKTHAQSFLLLFCLSSFGFRHGSGGQLELVGTTEKRNVHFFFIESTRERIVWGTTNLLDDLKRLPDVYLARKGLDQSPPINAIKYAAHAIRELGIPGAHRMCLLLSRRSFELGGYPNAPRETGRTRRLPPVSPPTGGPCTYASYSAASSAV